MSVRPPIGDPETLRAAMNRARARNTPRRIVISSSVANGDGDQVPCLTRLDGQPLMKAGPYIGPRGGKWADSKHTVPYKEESAKEHHKQVKDRGKGAQLPEGEEGPGFPWKRVAERAKGMSDAQLEGAIEDIRATLPHADDMDREMGGESRGGRYRDEASVYHKEMATRKAAKDKKSEAKKKEGAKGKAEAKAEKEANPIEHKKPTWTGNPKEGYAMMTPSGAATVKKKGKKWSLTLGKQTQDLKHATFEGAEKQLGLWAAQAMPGDVADMKAQLAKLKAHYEGNAPPEDQTKEKPKDNTKKSFVIPSTVVNGDGVSTQDLSFEEMCKAVYVGPRGGRYKDPQRKIAYTSSTQRKPTKSAAQDYLAEFMTIGGGEPGRGAAAAMMQLRVRFQELGEGEAAKLVSNHLHERAKAGDNQHAWKIEALTFDRKYLAQHANRTATTMTNLLNAGVGIETQAFTGAGKNPFSGMAEAEVLEQLVSPRYGYSSKEAHRMVKVTHDRLQIARSERHVIPADILHKSFVIPSSVVDGDSLAKAGGWMAIPGGKKGGQRKRSGMGWTYRYPEAVKPRPKAKPEPSKPKAERHWVSGAEAGFSDTAKANQVNGEYTAERKKLHHKAVAEFINHVPKVPASQKPVAIVTMGGPASGKTTLVHHIQSNVKDFANVNPDDVKECCIPEYDQALHLGKDDKGVEMSARDAAFLVHQESSDVADQVRQQAIKNHQNIILDGTGKDADKYLQKIKELKDAGYHVTLVMPHVPMEEAIQRVEARAEQTGRYVPEDIVKHAHARIPGNFEKLARACDEFALFKSERQQPPKKVWSGGAGQSDVFHDPGFVRQFKKTGQRLQHGVSQGMYKGDDKPPSVTLDELFERIETAEGVEDSIKSAPGGGNGEGVWWPVADYEDEIRARMENKIRKSFTVPKVRFFVDGLRKAGPFIGPRGGKWADPQHKIPWSDRDARAGSRQDDSEDAGPSRLERVGMPDGSEVFVAMGAPPKLPGAFSESFDAADVVNGDGPYKPGDTLHPGHSSAETAYTISDYPYGRDRTDMRVWVEKDSKGKQRAVRQTLNPKTGRWNNPKKSTYSDAMVMKMDDNGHVKTHSLNTAYDREGQIPEYLQKYGSHMSKPALGMALGVHAYDTATKNAGKSHGEAMRLAGEIKERFVGKEKPKKTATRTRYNPMLRHEADPVAYSKQLTSDIKKALKKIEGVESVKQGYKGKGGSAHRKQLWVRFSNGQTIDMFLDGPKVRLGGVTHVGFGEVATKEMATSSVAHKVATQLQTLAGAGEWD